MNRLPLGNQPLPRPLEPGKELVLLGVYVDDAERVAASYQARLHMRRLSLTRLENEHQRSVCVLLAGSDTPPWLAVFSGRGQGCTAAAILAERPPGVHRLVYFTGSYEDDLAWLRRRGLGFEAPVPLAGGHQLRRVSATLRELGVMVDLIERPPVELGERQWSGQIVDALLRAQRLPDDAEPASREGAARSPSSGAPPLSAPPFSSASSSPAAGASPSRGRGAELCLALDASPARWLEQIAAHPWSARCSSLPGGQVAPELAALLGAIARRGASRQIDDERREPASLAGDGLAARIGESIGAPCAVTASPLFLPAALADRVRRGATQRAEALRGLLSDLYAGVAGPVPPEVIDSNPFAYVRADWSAPRPAGLAQYLADVVFDAASGEPIVLADNADSGRCGLATLGALREHTRRLHGGALERLGARDPDDAVATLRQAVMAHAPSQAAGAPRAAICYPRDPPPFDLPHWEDGLLSRALGFPRVSESDLIVRDKGLYRTDGRGALERVDVLLHRRPATLYRFARWNSLVRAGRLAIVDPINSALCNDRALGAFMDTLTERYVGEAPAVAGAKVTLLLDPDTRRAALADAAALRFEQRGGKSGRRVVLGAELDGPGRMALAAALEDEPARWVARREVAAATALFVDADEGGLRVWEGEVSLRVFVLVGVEAVCPSAFLALVTPLGAARAAPSLADVVVIGERGQGGPRAHG